MRESAQRELDVHRHDDGNGLAAVGAGAESPLTGGLDRFLIQAERRIEGADDADVGADASRLHDALYSDRTLSSRSSHRFANPSHA